MIWRIINKYNNLLSGHQKIRIVELGLLMMIGGVLETCSVSLVVPFMNGIMKPEKLMDIWYVKKICGLWGIHTGSSFLIVSAVILALVYILKNVYLIFEFNIQYRFVYGNMSAMQKKLLGRLIHKPYEYFLHISSGEAIRLVNSDTAGTFQLLTTLLGLFTELVVSLMLVFTIFMITPYVTLAIAAVMLVIVCISDRMIQPVTRRAGEMNQKAAAGMNQWLLQAIQGIKELKVMGREYFFQSEFDRYGTKYAETKRREQVCALIPRFLIEAVCMSTMFILIAVLLYKGSSLEGMIPALSAVAMAALRLLPSVNRITAALAGISYYEPMLDRLTGYLQDLDGNGQASVPQESLYTRVRQGEHLVPELTDEIALNHVTYRYQDSDADVLTDASMIIKKGESVGITGSSGAGKTTAADILLGLLTPVYGTVTVDGVNICEDKAAWLEQTGYIPQTIFMLDGSIRENVMFGEKGCCGDEAVWHALEEAALAEFVKSLPDGLDTQIGERGVRLSGGQRQRIGIARALLRNPGVLIFDEATSALDHETEAAIMEAVRGLYGHKTIIMIAHRLTTIEGCDYIFHVENGKITRKHAKAAVG